MERLGRRTRRRLFWIGAVARAIGGIILLPVTVMILITGGYAFLMVFAFAWLSIPALLLFFVGHYLASNNKSYAHPDSHFPE